MNSVDSLDFQRIFSIAETLFDTLTDVAIWFMQTDTWSLVVGGDSVTGLETIDFTGSRIDFFIGGGLVFFLGFRLVKFVLDIVL